MRLIKGLVWYLAFSALCVAVTLAVMRQIAVRSGSEGLYEAWLGEIGDAFNEAGEFIGDCYERVEKQGSQFNRALTRRAAVESKRTLSHHGGAEGAE
jgi:hypothetical protein